MVAIRGSSEHSRAWAWSGGIAVLVMALAGLAIAVRSNPDSGVEVSLMRWVQDWSIPGLRRLMVQISTWTDSEGRVAVPLVAVIALISAGRARRGWAVALAAVTIAVMSFGFDYTLGQIVERGRPVSVENGTSFPSAHTFGSTVMFGFIAFLAFRHDLRMSLRVPLVSAMVTMIVLVGTSRVFLAMHWPTDVMAGYLLGAILLLLLIPIYGLCRAMCGEGDESLRLATATQR